MDGAMRKNRDLKFADTKIFELENRGLIFFS